MENGKQLIPQLSGEDSGDYTGTESESEDSDGKQLLNKDRDSLPQRAKLYLSSIKWRNVGAVVCLWIATMLTSAAYSTIAPFFPEEVCSYNHCGLCPPLPL